MALMGWPPPPCVLGASRTVATGRPRRWRARAADFVSTALSRTLTVGSPSERARCVGERFAATRRMRLCNVDASLLPPRELVKRVDATHRAPTAGSQSVPDAACFAWRSERNPAKRASTVWTKRQGESLARTTLTWAATTPRSQPCRARARSAAARVRWPLSAVGCCSLHAAAARRDARGQRPHARHATSGAAAPHAAARTTSARTASQIRCARFRSSPAPAAPT
eukprot:6588067-Prymnesium_polylepis.1